MQCISSRQGIVCYLFFILMVTSGCNPYLLRDNGFRGVRLGNQFDTMETFRWKDGAKRDTLLEEGGYEWRGVILEEEEGFVLVEEGFYGEEKINRIRVESKKFRTKFDITVGDPVSKLRQLSLDWILTPLPAYGKIDIYSETHPSFHFLVPWEGTGHEEEVSLTDIDDFAQVVGIVIM